LRATDDPIVGPGQPQDRLVGERLSGLANVGNGHHVVAKSTHCFNDWKWKVLVGEQARHRWPMVNQRQRLPLGSSGEPPARGVLRNESAQGLAHNIRE
jgi:hypothetical protein